MVVNAQWPKVGSSELAMGLSYAFNHPERGSCTAEAEVSPLYLPGKTLPEAGTAVAVWCGEEGAVLL
jgi:hypothetical protein